jgi:hypothetical protein
MDYHEAAGFLFDLRRFSMSPGVESVRDLLAERGDAPLVPAATGAARAAGRPSGG